MSPRRTSRRHPYSSRYTLSLTGAVVAVLVAASPGTASVGGPDRAPAEPVARTTSSSSTTDVAPGTSGTGWATVSAGDQHTCGVRTDGTLWCWGDDYDHALGRNPGEPEAFVLGEGQPTPLQVGDRAGWADVAAGGRFTCATRTDGTLWCWGRLFWSRAGDDTAPDVEDLPDLSDGPTRIGDGTDWTSVTAGSMHACALRRDGTVWCWSDNASGQLGDGTTNNRYAPTQVGKASDWTSVSARNAHTCGTRADGSLWCWGADGSGQLGDGRTVSSSVPVRVGRATGWRSVSAGYQHTCATRADGSLWCWGDNEYGQLGDGTTTGRPSPTRVGQETGWITVKAGRWDTCAVRDDGSRWCWGSKVTAPALQDTGPWSALTQAQSHACGIRTDGTLWCWGSNGRGQLGDGTLFGAGAVPQAQQVPGDGWTSIDAGEAHTCALRDDRSLWCWGAHGYRPSDGTASTLSPVRIVPGTTWSSVSAGDTHTCAVRTDGTLWCWGSNGRGQLGDGTTTVRTVPTQVGEDTDWASVSAGVDLTCAVRTDHTLWCWGYNAYGQTGASPETQKQTTPVRVDSDTTWVRAAAGMTHQCALRSSGDLWCRGGANGPGQLGSGTFFNPEGPVHVDGTGWVDVQASENRTCALRRDHTAWCWGTNTSGQGGDGTTGNNRPLPSLVASSAQWATLSAGPTHTCGVDTTGGLRCWGADTYGQLGDPTSTGSVRPTPQWVLGEHTWAAVTAGDSHTCAITTEGTAWCWGYAGSLGVKAPPTPELHQVR